MLLLSLVFEASFIVIIICAMPCCASRITCLCNAVLHYHRPLEEPEVKDGCLLVQTPTLSNIQQYIHNTD